MPQHIRFRNRLAIFIWAFAALWLTMLVIFSYLTSRDGPPEGYSVPAILAVLLFFWVGGIALTAYAASKACFEITVVDSSRVKVIRRYLFKVEKHTYHKERLNPASVISDKDSNGDKYYFARVIADDGVFFDLRESHDKTTCDQACAEFNEALFKKRVGV